MNDLKIRMDRSITMNSRVVEGRCRCTIPGNPCTLSIQKEGQECLPEGGRIPGVHDEFSYGKVQDVRIDSTAMEMAILCLSFLTPCSTTCCVRPPSGHYL